MKIQKLALLIPVLTLVLMAGMAHAELTPAEIMVKSTSDEVLAIIRADKEIKNGNMNKLGKLVEEKIASKFDFERMSKMVLGRVWNQASKEQQDQFTLEFRALLIRTYSSALSKYQNQTINYKPMRGEPADNQVTVKTQIIQQGGPAIMLDYSLEQTAEGWKVYDVTIEGLSLVVTYRGQFGEEVRQNGLDSLILKLAEKNKPASQPKVQA